LTIKKYKGIPIVMLKVNAITKAIEMCKPGLALGAAKCKVVLVMPGYLLISIFILN